MSIGPCLFEIVGLLASLAALAALLQHREHFSWHGFRAFLMSLILLNSFLALSNLLEWSAITTITDLFEDYLEILQPVLWGFLFYSIIQWTAEQDLRGSEEHYRSLFTENPAALLLIDPETAQIVEANSAACLFYGYTREELATKRMGELNTLSTEELLSAIGRAKTEKQNHFFFQHRLADGQVRDVEVYSGPIRVHGKQLLYSIVHDISDQKQAEEALRESEARFRNLLDYIPGVSIQGYGKEGTVRYWNKASEQVYGYTAAEAIGKNLGDLIIPAEIQPHFAKALELGANATRSGELMPAGEMMLRRKDASLVPVYSIHTVVCLEGCESLMFCIDVDLSERRRHEEALRESEETAHALLNASSDSAVLLDREGTILALNETAAKSVSESANEIVGKCIYTFFPPELGRSRKAKIDEVFHTGEPIRLEDERQGRSFDSTIYPIFNAAGKVVRVAIFARDVTDRKQLEEERIKTSKLEATGILAGGIAHDLNNIIMASMGNIELAKLYSQAGGKALDRLEEAEKASMRARDLAQQLLTFSRGGAPIKKPTSIVELMREAVGFALSGSNLKYDFDMPNNLWHVEADEAQISQVLNNIIINSVQAMPAGGTVKLCAQNEFLGSGNGLPLSPGRYVKINIQDQGKGVKKEHLAKIFDPYFTTRKTGSGLGLATVYSIIKNHQGYVSVDSEFGVGTTFSIYLPAAMKAIPETKPAQKQFSAGKGKILVMDDETMVRDVVKNMLTYLGYDVECAADGNQAIELYSRARDRGEPFDVVIMDLTIPGGMGGKDAIIRLREKDSQVKAIVSSGYADDPIMADFSKYGFIGVVSKPYKIDNLRTVLEKVTSE